MSDPVIQSTDFGNVDTQDAMEMVTFNYTTYAKYVLETRALPSIIDGLKFVQRRVLYVAAKKSPTLTKVPNITGDAIKLHPHATDSIDGTIIGFGRNGSRARLFRGKGNFGGYNFGAAAPRYLEAFMENYARYGFTQFDRYATYVQGEIDSMEPYALPALIPYSLMDGAKGMGVGLSTDIMPLNVLDTVDYFIDVINKVPDPRVPKPDLGNVIIDMDDEDWKNSVLRSRGRITTKSIIIQESDTQLVIGELYGRNISQVLKKVQKYIDSDIIDFRNESKTSMRLVFEVINQNAMNISQLRSILEKATTANTTFRRLVVDGHVAVYSDLLYQAKRTLKYLNEVLDKKFEVELQEYNAQIEVYHVIDYIKSSGLLDKITKSSVAQITEIIKKQGFSDQAISTALGKSIKYLTNSHNDEEKQVLDNIKSIKSIDRTEYLNELYSNYKEQLRVNLYDKVPHSIVRSSLLVNPRVKLTRDHTIMLSDKGTRFKNKIAVVYPDSFVTYTSISSDVRKVIDMSDDTHGQPADIVSDINQYALVVTNKGRALAINFDKNYNKLIMKLDEGEHVKKLYGSKSTEITYNDRTFDLGYLVKSRIAIPLNI